MDKLKEATKKMEESVKRVSDKIDIFCTDVVGINIEDGLRRESRLLDDKIELLKEKMELKEEIYRLRDLLRDNGIDYLE